MPRRRHDVPHEAVPFNAETKRGPVRQAYDAQGRRDIRQREREEVCDPQRRRHGQKVPELIPGAFLRLHEMHSQSGQDQMRGEKKKNLQSCRGVGLHNFADVTGELGERGADMAVFYDKRLGKVVRGGRRRLYSLQVSTIFASASHAVAGQAIEPGRPAKRLVEHYN